MESARGDSQYPGTKAIQYQIVPKLFSDASSAKNSRLSSSTSLGAGAAVATCATQRPGIALKAGSLTSLLIGNLEIGASWNANTATSPRHAASPNTLPLFTMPALHVGGGCDQPKPVPALMSTTEASSSNGRTPLGISWQDLCSICCSSNCASILIRAERPSEFAEIRLNAT